MRPTARHTARLALIAGTALALVALAGCGGGDDNDSATGTTTTSVAARPLRIMVTNDDGVGAAGIDTLVEALRKEPNVEVVVVAPAENKSGTGGSTTEGALTVTDAQTASGYPAKSVAGFPADTVVWAIDGSNVARPDLVMSGINQGQNLGPVINASGTVGAARAAAARGIPAVALSQGLADSPDYPTGAEIAVQWLRENRDRLEGVVVNINIPSCPTGSVRGVIAVPAATAGDTFGTPDCTSGITGPSDDIQAFVNGYVPLSVIPTAA